MSRYFSEETEETAAAEAQYQALKGLFAAYLHDSEELFVNQSTGMGETVKRYLNMDELRNSPIHKKFFMDVQACAQTLAGMLEQTPSPALARAAAELFFREKPKDMESCQRSWLIAAEALVIPILPYLTQEDAAAFCSSYEAQYRWDDMLPTQRDLYQALCDACGKKRHKTGFLENFFVRKKK